MQFLFLIQSAFIIAVADDLILSVKPKDNIKLVLFLKTCFVYYWTAAANPTAALFLVVVFQLQ